MRGLEGFKKLCISENYPDVVMVKTRWDKVSCEEGSRRESELVETPDFWGDLGAGGAIVTTTSAGKTPAQLIMQRIVWKNKQWTLSIQEEMGDANLAPYETGAGGVLYKSSMEKIEMETEVADVESKLEEESKATTKSAWQS